MHLYFIIHLIYQNKVFQVLIVRNKYKQIKMHKTKSSTPQKSYNYSFGNSLQKQPVFKKTHNHIFLKEYTVRSQQQINEKQINNLKKPVGLANIGNTCFLNSILQFLYAADQIKNFLIQTYGKQQNMQNAKFSKLIGKLFFHLQEKSKDQSIVRNILKAMILKLQSLNTQYKKNFQEDALQSLLNILLQIQEKHPSLVSALDIEYKAFCGCQEYVTKQRVLSYSQNGCVSCRRQIKRTLTNQPQYIIYSNAAGRSVEPTRTEKGGILSNIDLRYKLMAQIVYYGNGRQGHYTARRFQEGRLYQFSDSTVQQVKATALCEKKALILLYKLQPQQSNQKSDLRPNTIMRTHKRDYQVLLQSKKTELQRKVPSINAKINIKVPKQDNRYLKSLVKPTAQLLCTKSITIEHKQHFFEVKKNVNSFSNNIQKNGTILLQQRKSILQNNYFEKKQSKISKQKKQLINLKESLSIKAFAHLNSDENNLANKNQKDKFRKPNNLCKKEEPKENSIICLFELQILSGFLSKKTKELLYQKRQCLVELIQASQQITFIRMINLKSFPYYAGHQEKYAFHKADIKNINSYLQQIGKYIQNSINKCIRSSYNLSKTQDLEKLCKQNKDAKDQQLQWPKNSKRKIEYKVLQKPSQRKQKKNQR